MNLNMAQYAWDTGALVSILGLATVFAVLAIIMIVLMIMERVFAKKPATPKKEIPAQEMAVADVQKPKEEAPVAQVEAKASDESELVAVITAAIAASLGVPERSLKIKSFKRVGRAWSDSSRQENIYNSL